MVRMINMAYLKILFIYHCLTYLGKPYIWGGNTPIEGMDCSGFVQVVLDAFGMDPPGDQTANDLFLHFSQGGVGRPIAKQDKGGYPIGALLFFGTGERMTHVALSIGRGFMVEAGGGGRTTTDAAAAARQKAYVRMKPVNVRTDLRAVIIPVTLPWL